MNLYDIFTYKTADLQIPLSERIKVLVGRYKKTKGKGRI